MSSNPLWCQPVEEWRGQINSRIGKNIWNDYRHLLILMDGRPLFGSAALLTEVRAEVFKHIRRSPQVLYRMMENTKHIKKPLGVFGQFLIKTHGPYSGCIHVKESGILLYVNAVRLLAMQECIEVTPTLSRLDALAEASADHGFWNPFREGFLLLWQYRMQFASAQEGEGVHYIDIGELDHHQKRELKQALKNGMKLHRFAQHRIEKEGKGSRRK
jgi:CBS domain-containing protein